MVDLKLSLLKVRLRDEGPPRETLSVSKPFEKRPREPRVQLWKKGVETA